MFMSTITSVSVDDAPQTRTLVRTESILTQLIFEHSLRIRMKAETKNMAGSRESTANPTPAGASTPEERDRQESSSGETTLQGSSESVISTKGKKATDGKPADEVAKSEPSEDRSSNLVGKINNLVTTDLANITNARDFLFIRALEFPLLSCNRINRPSKSCLCSSTDIALHLVPLSYSWLEVYTRARPLLIAFV